MWPPTRCTRSARWPRSRKAPRASALQRVSAEDLASLLEVRNSKLRVAAAQVIGRFYARRPWDPPVDASIGDALLAALNDKDRGVKAAAMQALGDIRYEPAVQVLTETVKSHAKGDDFEGALDTLARIAQPVERDAVPGTALVQIHRVPHDCRRGPGENGRIGEARRDSDGASEGTR